jgi:hypothetical protein
MRTARPLSEKEFMAQVVTLARLCGWRTCHTFDSRRSTAGFPDLVMLRGPNLVFAELKVGTNTPTDEQTQWVADLAAVRTVSAGLWYPADWKVIEATLTGH